MCGRSVGWADPPRGRTRGRERRDHIDAPSSGACSGALRPGCPSSLHGRLGQTTYSVSPPTTAAPAMKRARTTRAMLASMVAARRPRQAACRARAPGPMLRAEHERRWGDRGETSNRAADPRAQPPRHNGSELHGFPTTASASSWCVGREGTDAHDHVRSQWVNATASANFVDGGTQPSVWRGRPLSSAATASSRAWVIGLKSVPLGK